MKLKWTNEHKFCLNFSCNTNHAIFFWTNTSRKAKEINRLYPFYRVVKWRKKYSIGNSVIFAQKQTHTHKTRREKTDTVYILWTELELQYFLNFNLFFFCRSDRIFFPYSRLIFAVYKENNFLNSRTKRKMNLRKSTTTFERKRGKNANKLYWLMNWN